MPLQPSQRFRGDPNPRHLARAKLKHKSFPRMRDLTVTRLYEILGGRLRFATRMPLAGEQTPVGHVVTDSRQIRTDDVFWALPGSRVDGAEFVEEAYRRGASGVIVSGRYVQPWPGCWSLEVPNAPQA